LVRNYANLSRWVITGRSKGPEDWVSLKGTDLYGFEITWDDFRKNLRKKKY